MLLSSLAVMANEHVEYRFKHLSESDGLLHSNVTAIETDSAGFMWFGTHRGLNRFDGYTVDSWRHTSDNELDVYYNRIYSLGAIGNQLWMGTGAGLACFDMSAKEFLRFEFIPVADNGEFSRNIEYVLPDVRRRRLWVRASNIFKLYEITDGEGPVKIRNVRIGSSNAYKAAEPSPKVAFDNNGHVWFSGCEHLECYNEDPAGNLAYEGEAENVTGNNIKALLYDDNALWIAYHSSVARYAVRPDGALYLIDRVEIPTSVGVNSMAVGEDYVWVGAQDGVFRLPKHDITDLRVMHPASDVNCVKVDRFDNIWISGWDSGIAYAGTKADFFGTLRFPSSRGNANGNAVEFISSLHADPDGYIYVGSKFGGIGRINAVTKEAVWGFCTDPCVNGAHITALNSDDRHLYAAVDNYVASINKATRRVEEIMRSKHRGYIFGLAFDRFGRMWLATYAGLECMERNRAGKWQSCDDFRDDSPAPYALTTNLLHNIFSDTEKNELIVTSTSGLNRVILDDAGNVERILQYHASDAPESERLSSDFLWPIDRADAPSTYWVGTMGSGLNKITFIDCNGSNTYRAIHYRTSPGNMSDDVESIQTDRFGRVWCAGTGLGYFDESLAKFNRYGLSDGLQGSRFGTSSSTRDSSGTLWFGGVNGLNYFVPERENSADVLTDVVFSGASVGVKPVDGFNPNTREIQLKYPDNNLTVKFSTLSYATTSHVSYRYKLEGYDNDWHYIDPGQTPEAVYSKLPYKRMRLIVEAGDWRDWSGKPSYMTINSEGPWWLSWWAWTIYAIAAIVVIGFIAYNLNERSKRKRAEAVSRERNLQQQEVMRMKMRFFTDVSHEFRTPLTLIRHAAGELGGSTDGKDRYVKLIARNAGVLANMVNELLDFHRVDIGSTPLRTTLTSVVGMISSIVEEFSVWAEESGLSISFSSREQEIDMWIDREQVSKIISNIISNSIRYTDAGGCIEVMIDSGLYQDVVPAYPSKYSIVSSMIPGRQLIVRVRDTGSGIAAASLSVIFERFRQPDDRSRSTAASGIGLSLVKALTMLHHGGLVVSSEEGVGTEMILFIPMTYDYLTPEQKIGDSDFAVKDYLQSYGAAYQTVDIAPQRITPGDSEAVVMVVDDNREILDLLAGFFAEDYEVITASSAEEALEIVGERLPDLILSDVMMPGMNGLEFCAKLKTDLQTCHIPVVLLTAMANEENQIEGIEIGADAYIAKPFNPKLLKATVRNLLARVRRDIPRQQQSSRREIKNRKERELFERFENLVRENLTNPDYSIDSIWAELGLNRTRLYAMVKEVTGIPLGAYVKKIRLEQAAKLLLTTDMSVSEVAYSVGIENLAYFSRLFKNEYGASPTEWIKNNDNTSNNKKQ